MRKQMSIYLAGPFVPYRYMGRRFADWRDYVIEEVGETKRKTFYDPRRDSSQLCPGKFTLDDALGVLKCGAILAVRLKGREAIGSNWEEGIAFAINLLKEEGVKTRYPQKLIINVDECNAPWPLSFASSSVNFSNLPIAVEFLKEIHSSDKWGWMPVYMGIVDDDRRSLTDLAEDIVTKKSRGV